MSLNFTFHTNEILKEHGLQLQQDRETNEFNLVDAETHEVASEERTGPCIVDLEKRFGSLEKLCSLYAQTDKDLEGDDFDIDLK